MITKCFSVCPVDFEQVNVSWEKSSELNDLSNLKTVLTRCNPEVMMDFIFELILSLSKLEDARESYSYTKY